MTFEEIAKKRIEKLGGTFRGGDVVVMGTMTDKEGKRLGVRFRMFLNPDGTVEEGGDVPAAKPALKIDPTARKN